MPWARTVAVNTDDLSDTERKVMKRCHMFAVSLSDLLVSKKRPSRAK